MPGLSQATEDREDRGVFAARAVPLGPPSTDQLEVIRAHVLDGAILETNEPYVWAAIASNDREDAYATRMHRSTLENFAADATDGVAFMNSHRTGGFIGSAELPLGRTFDGKLIGASASGPLRTEVTSFTLRGLNLTGLSTDAFIDGLRAGIARDVSVGFYGGEYRCSICDRDMFRDWECRHWPGREYPKLDGKGKEIEGETVRAVAWIHNARLAELSTVYDGACPGAMVKKARGMAEAGELKAVEIDFLEARYRIAGLPRPARSFGGADIPAPPEEERMDPTELTAEQVAQIRLLMVGNGQAADADFVPALVACLEAGRTNAGAAERMAAQDADLARLRPLADEGRAYRADLVTNALAEGARAYGTEFSEETYRALLEAAPLETVKRMAADWKAVGDKQFPGGRLTKDETEPTPITARKRRPAAAYS